MKRRENTITMPDETTLCENIYGIKFKRGKVQYCRLNYIKNIIQILQTIYLPGSVYTQCKQLEDGKQ